MTKPKKRRGNPSHLKPFVATVMTDEICQEVTMRYRRGDRVADIAQELNISYAAVSKWIYRHLPPRERLKARPRKGQVITEEIGADIQIMKAEGQSYSEIAQKLGVKMSTVRSYLDRQKAKDFGQELEYVDNLLLEIKTLRKENERLNELVTAYKNKIAEYYQTEIIRTLAGDTQVIDLEELTNKNKNQK